MSNYLGQINSIKTKLDILQKESFEAASNGTHHKVFLSNRYVIRFRDKNPKLLLREADFLKQLSHPLIPKVLWSGEIDESTAMVENRLPGKTINTVWRTLPKANQMRIVKQVVEFLQYLKTQANNHIYSVNTGKKYDNFSGYLTDNIEQKIDRIKRFKQANKLLESLLLVIEGSEVENLFSSRKIITVVHGDLIIHNLLTNGRDLTGVLDWELALFGNPEYDLFRIFYYQECAKSYQEQGIDETFEADYMDKLIAVILKSNLMEDKELFQRKYKFVRAVFFLSALYWAANSDNPEKNFAELILRWDKNEG